jgi:microcystin-dependent protein
MAYLTPDEFGCEEAISFSLAHNLIPHLYGVLSELANKEAWEQFGALEPEEISQYMIALMLSISIDICEVTTMPVGAISMYGGAAAPTGWLLCDGAAVSRATYAVLFAIIGTAFGVGDGSTTFNLPNFADKFSKGKGADAVGETGGANSVTLDESQIPSHTHREVNNAGSAFAFFAGGGANYDVQATNPTTSTTPRTTGATGGGGSHENRPAYLNLNFIIAYE